MEVEWLILADSAQVNGNKLYMLGGGWDRLTMNRPLPASHQMAVAIAFLVDWNETNRKHQFEIELVDADGVSIGRVQGEFEVGRPPGIPAGQSQRMQTAVGLNFPINRLGTYAVVAKLDGAVKRQFPFTVVGGAPTRAA